LIVVERITLRDLYTVLGAKICVMRADLKPGAKFPDIELPDWQGKMQKLSDIQGPDPMVVVFYRGLF